MRVGAIGPWTFGQEAEHADHRGPCLVLAITLIFGYVTSAAEIRSEELEKFRSDMAASAQALDSLFDKVALLPRCVAARQAALKDVAVPDSDTPNILRQVLETAAPRECYGLYIAFDGIDPTRGPRDSRDSTGIPTGVPPADEAGLRSQRRPEGPVEWYWGPRHDGPRTPQGDRRGDGPPYYTEPYFDEGATNVLVVSVTRPSRIGTGIRRGGGSGMDCRSLNKFIRSIIPEQGRARGTYRTG